MSDASESEQHLRDEVSGSTGPKLSECEKTKKRLFIVSIRSELSEMDAYNVLVDALRTVHRAYTVDLEAITI